MVTSCSKIYIQRNNFYICLYYINLNCVTLHKYCAVWQFHFPKVIARTAFFCFMNIFLRKFESSTDQMISQYSRYGSINVWYSKSSVLVFKFFLVQYRITVFLFTLVQTVLIWSFNFNLSLIITPKISYDQLVQY